MPRAESSDAYLDRVMALAASQARAGRVNHAAAAKHAAVANHGGAYTADQRRIMQEPAFTLRPPRRPKLLVRSTNSGRCRRRFGPCLRTREKSNATAAPAVTAEIEQSSCGGCQVFCLPLASPGRSRMRRRGRSLSNQNLPPPRPQKTFRPRRLSNNNNQRCR